MKITKYCILGIVTIGNRIYSTSGQSIVDNIFADISTTDDADVRFNKFELFDPSYNHFLPLGSIQYPISGNSAVVTMLKKHTNAVTVVDSQDDVELVYDVDKLIEKVGGLPDHPSIDLNTPYWDKLNKVIDMRILTINNRNRPAMDFLDGIMQLPIRWENYTMHEVAEAVHDEYPGLHQSEFIADLLGPEKKYGPVTFDDDIIPARANAQFLRGIVMLSTLNSWSIGKVGPHIFGAKWFDGRARPEEVVSKILNSTLTAPQSTVEKLQNFPEEITHPENFTNYQEGAPRHPSWPAMHSAASNISFWIQIVMKLSPKQLCEVKKVDYAVAYARTIAGVHFEDDNVAGLNMGQYIVKRALPRYLYSMYKSSRKKVKRKSRRKQFNWENYDPTAPCV